MESPPSQLFLSLRSDEHPCSSTDQVKTNLVFCWNLTLRPPCQTISPSDVVVLMQLPSPVSQLGTITTQAASSPPFVPISNPKKQHRRCSGPPGPTRAFPG